MIWVSGLFASLKSAVIAKKHLLLLSMNVDKSGPVLFNLRFQNLLKFLVFQFRSDLACWKSFPPFTFSAALIESQLEQRWRGH